MREYFIGVGLLFCAIMLVMMHQLVWSLLPAIAANVILWGLLKKVK